MPPAIIAAGLGAGSAFGASALQGNATSNAANAQLQLGQQLINQRQPAYNAAYNYYSGILGDPKQAQTALAPDINATNMFFNSARQNILNSSVARGGGTNAALANLEGGKALSLSQLYYGIRPQAASALANMASGQTTQAIGALQGASTAGYYNSMLQGQAASGIGGFLANLLGTPGLFGNNISSASLATGAPPSAIVPSTGQPYPGWNQPYGSLI